MRTITFEVFAPTGPAGAHIEGTVADLLEYIPYLLAMRIIPPLEVVNDVLRRGHSDAGMSGGCRWEPFKVDSHEWEELREALEARATPHRYVAPPEWVSSFADWHAWLFEHLYGVPASEHRRLQEQDVELGQEIARALADNDQDRVVKLHAQRNRVNEELSSLFTKHLHRRK
jgi:hypothetical protein